MNGYSGQRVFSSALRTLIKGALLGAVVGLLLGMGYVALLTAIASAGSGSIGSQIASTVIGFPTWLLLSFLEWGASGALIPMLIVSLATGATLGAVVGAFEARLPRRLFVVAAVGAALLIAMAFVLSTGEVTLRWHVIPALIYAAFSGWLAYRLRWAGAA